MVYSFILILFQPADGSGKNPKYVDYCKENGICLPINLVGLSYKFFWFHVTQNDMMSRTKTVVLTPKFVRCVHKR
jgi:hypothetical protein